MSDETPKSSVGAPRSLAAGAPARKPRADAVRNRERLLAAAKAGFAKSGPEVTFEEVARRADVGIGTLYRHFPTRDSLVEAVYRREAQQLADAAPRLLALNPPDEALRAWMHLFLDYIATKKIIAPMLGAIVSRSPDLAASSARIVEAIGLLVERAKAAETIRASADPNDVMRALIGFAYSTTAPDWRASAGRLIDILIDGLRAGRPAP